MSRGSTTIDPTKSWLNCYHKDKISGIQGRLRLTREHKKAICDFIRDSRKANDNRTEDDVAYLEKFAREIAHFDPQESELAAQMLSKIKTRMHNVRCELRKVDTMGNAEQEDGRPNGIPEDDARTKKLKGLLKTDWSKPEDWSLFVDAAIAVHGEEFAEFLRDRLLIDDPLDQTHIGDDSTTDGGAAGGWTAVNSSAPEGLKAPIDLKNRQNGHHDVVVSPQTSGVPHINEPDAPKSKPGQPHPSPAPSFKRRKLSSAEEESNDTKPTIIEAAKTIYKLTMERSSQIRERAGKTTIDEKRSDTMFFWEKENANRKLEEEWTKIGVGQYGLEKDDDGRSYGNVVQSGDWGTRSHKMSIEGEKVRVLRRPGQEGRQIDIITSREIEDEEAVKFDGA